MTRLPAELAQPAEWHLPSGLSAAPGWRWLARVGLLFLIALALTWWFGVVQGWRAGQGPHGLWVLLSTGVVLIWCGAVARPAWRALGSATASGLTLQWRGFPAESSAAPDGPSCWHLPEPGVDADLACALDLQGWLLLKVTPRAPEAASAFWSLLPDRPDASGDIHRLRVLLRLSRPFRASARSTSTPNGEGRAGRMVASSASMVGLPASPTARPPMIQTLRHRFGAAPGHAATGTPRAPRLDAPSSVFPATEFEPDRRGL